MNKSRAVQNNLETNYCHQYLYAHAMFHLTEEALSSNRLTRNTKVEIYLGLFLDLKWRLHIRPLTPVSLLARQVSRVLHTQATK